MDAADGNVANGNQLPYRFCDDGVPDQGGVTPNVGAVKAVAVPASYDGHLGLPAQAAGAATEPGADPTPGHPGRGRSPSTSTSRSRTRPGIRPPAGSTRSS